MNNYKIRVNNEAESREAQELFFELGYRSGIASNNHFPVLVIAHDCGYGPESTTAISMDHEHHKYYAELTLPQLHDLAVLHRNDYTDATHVDQDGWKWFISSDNNSYVFGAGNSQGLPRWDESPLDHVYLTPIQKPQKIQEQGLISGADALRALADGEEVEYSHGEENCVRWTTIRSFEEYSLDVFLGIGTRFKFRLKPRTVKLEIEVPSPFEPKYGDYVFTIDSNATDGWTKFLYQASMERKIIYGAWRTEAEIKIVVEQLRKLKEHSK
ncbi:hypothetical protein [Acinetobacter soli]|uniref:hypothetical protein n=1 Tax=Acinetobacter soli TaxID=487316 RepID=UPI001D0A5345|nr:hypothetical protein [Acinetobacter soli]MCB8769546.1 hypothetical protein [Acinetobacter soli]